MIVSNELDALDLQLEFHFSWWFDFFQIFGSECPYHINSAWPSFCGWAWWVPEKAVA